MSSWLTRKTEQITELQMQISQLHAQLLDVIAEVDAAEAWRSDGARSMDTWLTAHLRVDHATARRWVRTARRLVELPEIRRVFTDGDLTVDQVTALTRFATPQDDPELADSAPEASVNQLQRQARRREKTTEHQTRTATERRSLRWRWDHGLLHVTMALPQADGTGFIHHIDRALGDLPPDPDRIGTEPLHQRRLDALTHLLDATNSRDPERATLVLHMDIADLSDPQAVAETEHRTIIGGAPLRRLLCDPRIETSLHQARNGTVVGIGRASRRIPPWLARAVNHRDQGCRFPGCETTLWTHHHHLVHWADGGPTTLNNLITLCAYHHRLIHDHGWTITGNPNHHITWNRPDGTPYVPGHSRLRHHQIRAGQLMEQFKNAAAAAG